MPIKPGPALPSAPGALIHPRYHVIPRGSDKLVVFFSGSSVADHVFHWWNMGQRIPASVMLVNNGRNEWYAGGIPGLGNSYADTLDSFRAWATHLGATQIYMCGSSMGGSGALMYGAPLGAPVLALGFESRLDYPWGNVQRLMIKGYKPPFADLRSFAAQATAPIFVYAGEGEPVDLLSAQHLSDLPRVSVMALRNVSHGPANNLKKRGLLDPIFDAFLNNDPLPVPANARAEGLLPGMARTLYDAYCAWKEKRNADMLHLAQRAVELGPDFEFALMLLGKALILNHRPAEAIPVLNQAVRLNRGRYESWFLLGSAHERTGDLPEAVKIYKQILSQHEHALSAYALGRIYAAKRSYRSAARCFERALAIEPRANFRQALAALPELPGPELPGPELPGPELPGQ